MPLVVPDDGENELLDKMLKDALSTDECYVLRLYANNYTPVAGTVSSSFTEADFTNYASKTLTRAGWGAASTVSNKASSTYSAAQAWTCGSTGNTIYGYYVHQQNSPTKVLWAERFSSARILANNDVLSITPVVTLSTE